jgi:YesN/AraC family two-component response regulator
MKVKPQRIFNQCYLIEKSYSVDMENHGNDISGPYWMLINVEVKKGKVKWKVDTSFVEVKESSFWVFIPKYSWTTEYYASNTELFIKGIISNDNNFSKFKDPVIFYGSFSPIVKQSDLNSFIESIEKGEIIKSCLTPSALSQKVKNIIEKTVNNNLSISDIARQLNTSNAVISRYFKKDFGQSPSAYKKGLRSTIGMYSLLTGDKPEIAAHKAGYNDISRFYKQFKEYIGAPPSSHYLKSKNAKTSSS